MASEATEPASAGAGAERAQARAYLRLIVLAALIGIPAALLAAVFLAFVHDLEHWLWIDLPDSLGHDSPPWYLVVGLPLAGACVVVAARALLPGDGGHRPIDGLGGAPTPVAHGPGVALAAIGTLAFGAVLGPEAPLIALGSVVGLALTSFARLGSREQAIVANAGSFSAISALFGGPLVGGVLMVEAGAAGLGAALLPVLLPGFVAAAVGYVVFVGLGDWGGLDAQGLAVPGLPLYDGAHVEDFVVAIVVGIAAAVVVAAVRRAVRGIASTPRLSMPALLLAGGLAVGGLAELADILGADSQDVLFSGQASVPNLVAEDSTKIVLILLVAKGLAYAVSMGCGFRGGPVFPAIFLGIALATLLVIWFDLSTTLAVGVGAAAGTAAVTRMLLTPMLFASLLVGRPGVDAVPAIVIAAAAAWLAMAVLEPLPRAAPAADVEPATSSAAG
jgi:H+/Cl- antiporter ClcA